MKTCLSFKNISVLGLMSGWGLEYTFPHYPQQQLRCCVKQKNALISFPRITFFWDCTEFSNLYSPSKSCSNWHLMFSKSLWQKASILKVTSHILLVCRKHVIKSCNETFKNRLSWISIWKAIKPLLQLTL